jgi:hypothetical protein
MLDPPYLPGIYALGEEHFHGHDPKGSMLLMLGEWFDDFHEWHLVPDPEGGGQRVCLWDTIQGERLATEEQKREIFRQASRILTLYFDDDDFRHIYPWHHAAGDFIVRTRSGRTDVRLTTARRYEPIMAFPSRDKIHAPVALVTFFLHLGLRMRLDKREGTGEVIWAAEDVLPCVIGGFLQGMEMKEGQGGGLFKGGEIAALLKSFTGDEMMGLMNPLMDHYEREDPADFAMIRRNLSRHAEELHRALQDFPG